VELREHLEELRASDRPRLELWPDRASSPRSVALLAGSFDPVTVAHVAMAEAAREQAELVVLVYAVRTLPKDGGAAAPLLTEDERIASLAAVCSSRDGLTAGLASHGLLADQAAAARGRFPGASITVVVGSDKLSQLFDGRWYDGDRDAVLAGLFALADVRYSIRAGDEVGGALAAAASLGYEERIRPLDVDPAIAAVSSRAIRERARAGADVSGWIPREALGWVVDALAREGD